MPAYAVDASPEPSGPPAALPPAAVLPAAHPLPPADPRLVVAVVRDIALGRRLAALAWVVGLLHAGLGFVVLRQAALLVGIDSSLSTTSAVEELGANALGARIALAIAVAILALVGIRWGRRAAATMESLEASSLAGGGPIAPVAGSERRRWSILLRPVGAPGDGAMPFEQLAQSGRRLALVALLVTLISAVVGLAAAVGIAGAATVEAAREWRWVAAASSAGWVVATLLVGAVIADITWRIAVVARRANIVAPLADLPGRLALRLVPALLLVVGAAPIALSPATDPAPVSCGTSTLECAAVEVPVDHVRGASSGTFRLVYGVHRATAGRIGTLVVAVGGPGASGLESAESMLAGFDPDLLDRYDIVFWDQRGTGRSDGHDCPRAGGVLSSAETTADAGRRFVQACLRESRTDPAGLGRYATAEAAEDVESIRRQLGVEKLALYGESYGTELAQTYAAAHPDRLSALILDGAVDLTLSANDFWAAAARSFDRSLRATFDACAEATACSADVRHPADAYDRFLESLKDGDRNVRFADPDGVVRDHSIRHDAFESAIDGLLYEPVGRMLIQRAVAAWANGDDVPLARLTDLLGPGITSASMFAYHAVMCADYRVSPTENVEDIDAVLVNGKMSGALDTRTDEIYLIQVPCLYWPEQPASAARPAALTDLPVPIIVLAATLDPITPVEFGRSIAERAADGYLIETVNGPHVTFGRGDLCVDRPVVRFLLGGDLPRNHTLKCSGDIADPYVPVTPTDAADFIDALDAMGSLEDELLTDPGYLFWEGDRDARIGCQFGGTVKLATTRTADTFALDKCEMARGMELNGTAEYSYREATFSADVTFEGGSLEYTSGNDRSVRGVFRGRHVDLHD